MSPSSTSNSSSFDLKGFRPWGALFCLVLLAIVEFGFARQEWLWAKFPKSPAGIVDAVEEAVIKPVDNPVLIVLGNSRTRDAVVPTIMESKLNLQRGEVLNLSLTAGEPFDSYILYKRNRDAMRRAQLIVLAVEEWQLNDDRAISERFRRFASFDDRLSYPDRKMKASLLAGWMWRTFDARKPLGRFGKELLLPTDRNAPIGDDGRVVWRTDDPEFGEETVDLTKDLQRAYGGFKAERMKQTTGYKYLARTIEMAQEDGLRVALVSPPYRDAFIEARTTLRGPNDDTSFQDLLESLAGLGEEIEVLEVSRASQLGMPDTTFIDYGHMLSSGAEVYSRHLADWLQENYGKTLP